jgi:SRSO17 transposase
MTPAGAQRHEEWWRDGIVSAEVFTSLVERRGDFVVPSQPALATAAAQRQVPLSRTGRLSHVPRQHAAAIATVVDGERLVLHAFLGPAPWEHPPLVRGLGGPVGEQLGAPDGLIAFAPSGCPKRGTPAVGVKRPWGRPRGKGANCQGGGVLGYVSRPAHAWLDFRLSLPPEWARDEPRRPAWQVPEEGQ